MLRKLIHTYRLVNSRPYGQRRSQAEESRRWNLSSPMETIISVRSLWLRPVLIAASVIVLLHLVLLALAIPDYRVTIDSAYHIALGREWAEHWPALWDRINYGPEGRPNLQGPLFQIAIGALGWTLGGAGADYVHANAILAVLQWLVAIGTAAVIAYKISGEWAALFAVSLITGAGFTSTSFAIGIPSGWVFIFTAWAIYYLVRERDIAAGLAASLAIYCHIGGFATAPLGMFAAATFSRRWRELIRAGVIAGVLTAPYALFVLYHLRWFSGERSHSALLFDPLLDALAIAGAIRVFRRARKYPLMAGWLIAPVAWLPHDPGRFILQWGLGGGVAAVILLAAGMNRAVQRRRALILGCAFVLVTQLFPLGIPSLAPEIAWDLGLRYPREINWDRARTLAGEIKANGMHHRLIVDYQPALCMAIAVYQPVTCENGHWIEVQPRVDPADYLPATTKVYVLPLPSTDSELTSFQTRGWVATHGSADDNTIVTLAANLPPDATRLASSRIVHEAAWLGANAINNTIELSSWRSGALGSAQLNHQRALAVQRIHAGRLELAALIEAQALETSAPAKVWRMRRVARGFGVIASLLGDEMSVDYLSDARMAKLRTAFKLLSATADPQGATAFDPALVAKSEALLRSTFDGLPKTFAERPAGNTIPWFDALWK